MNRRKFLNRLISGSAVASPLLAGSQRARSSPASRESHSPHRAQASPTLQHPPVPQLEPRLPRIENIWYEEPVAVGTRKQLLVDDFLISHRDNITRELQRAAKANGAQPVLVHDKPWEDPNYIQVKSVFREDNRFRMWYWGREWATAYAESEDGFLWRKPSLGIHEFRGSKDNNLTDLCESCYLDPHDTDPAHKYKAAYHPSKPPYAACLAYSSDGYRWTPYNNGEPVTYRAADTLNQIIWDEDAQVYRLFTRTDFATPGGDMDCRGAREMINPDVRANPTNWLTIQNWKFDREGFLECARRQIHTLNLWMYEGVHFGLMCVYEYPATSTTVKVDDYAIRHERDVWNFYIGTRRPGPKSAWDLTWVYAEKPLIPRGSEGSFDKDIIHASSTVITWKDQHWIYYSGFPIGHFRMPSKPAPIAGSIGLATVPLDRFIFWAPWIKDDLGWLITKPFKVEGNTMEVNADAKEGWLAAEFLEAHTGKPIPGFTRAESVLLEGTDGFRLHARWQRQPTLAPLFGRAIRLKFYLHNAKLYSFQIL